MQRFGLVFSDDMSIEDKPGVFVYTAFSGRRRYVEDATIRKVGKEKRISIVSNAKLWKAYQFYREKNHLSKDFLDVQGRELDGRLWEALRLEEVGERVALLGLPYHRFAKDRESIAFFFAACEKIIADLFEWYGKVIFVPPKLSPKKEKEGFLNWHNQQLQKLQSSFLNSELEIIQNEKHE